MRWFVLPMLLLLFDGTARGQAPSSEDDKGQIVTKKVRFGEYVQYRPKREAVGVLVVVHGMPSEEDSKNIEGLAERFAKRWAEFAEAKGLVLVSPIFNNEDFDSVDGDQGGGYRGLFGRQIGADAYVNGIVEQVKPLVAKDWDGRIVLYGHSAGGQFASRYAVKYPNRLRVAVISAAGTYAMPDPKAEWPNGTAPMSKTFYWGPSKQPQPVSVNPDPNNWFKAASTVPITVVVGATDLEPQKPRAGHFGVTRVDRGRQWVAAMNRLAKSRRKEGKASFVVVEGVGHDSARLTPAAQKALSEVLDAR